MSKQDPAERVVSGEGTNVEHKSSFEPKMPGAMLKLVKHLVALANSGGGIVRVGATETEQLGVDEELLPYLDGAAVGDLVNKYIQPASANVSHYITLLDSGRIIIDLEIEASGRYPYVFSHQGQYEAGKKNKHAFRKGDVYVRHGAKSAPITYEHLVSIIEDATRDAIGRARDTTMQQVESLIRDVAKLPLGIDPVLLGQSMAGELLGTAGAAIDFKIQRRKDGHRGSLLDAVDLLLSFIQRDSYAHTTERLEMLIRSSLRRPPTLYFWLAQVSDSDFVADILLSSLLDTDRDVSDAGPHILEVGVLFLDEDVLNELLQQMAKSEYKKIRDVADGWEGRDKAIAQFLRRVHDCRLWNESVMDLSVDEIIVGAESLAKTLMRKLRSPVLSRNLSDLGRAVFVKQHPDMFH